MELVLNYKQLFFNVFFNTYLFLERFAFFRLGDEDLLLFLRVFPLLPEWDKEGAMRYEDCHTIRNSGKKLACWTDNQ